MCKSKFIILYLAVVILVACIEQRIGSEPSVKALEIKPEPSISDSPSSSEIQSKAADVYQHLDSYQDEGVSERSISGRDVSDLRELHFTTAFTRSGNFRFEFWEPDKYRSEIRYVVWKKGSDVKSWWTVNPKMESGQDIGLAISGATGVSGGTAYTIPSVLMKESAWKEGTWTSLPSSYRVKDGVDRGTYCFRIQFLTSTKGDTYKNIKSPATKGMKTYWISKDKFLLMKIDSETNFGTFLSKASIHYSPKINAPIPDAAFEFGH